MESDKYCIIVSRYNEKVDWLTRLSDTQLWINKIIIYNKGLHNLNESIINHPRIQIIEIENIGREGETYLNYIINNYNNLPDNLWFIQGDPFEHSPDFINLMQPENHIDYTNKLFQPLSCRYTKTIPPLSDCDHRFYINNNKIVQYYIDSITQQTVEFHAFEDFSHRTKVDYLNSIIPKHSLKHKSYLHYMCSFSHIPQPKSIIPYCWSSIFFVKKQGILKNSLDTYKKLRKILLSSNDQGGYQGFVLERLWQFIFTHKSYNSLNELNLKPSWPYSKHCGLYDSDKHILYIHSNSHKTHKSRNKPLHHKHKHMLYYNIERVTIETVKNTYFKFKHEMAIFCFNMFSAQKILKAYIEFDKNKLQFENNVSLFVYENIQKPLSLLRL